MVRKSASTLAALVAVFATASCAFAQLQNQQGWQFQGAAGRGGGYSSGYEAYPGYYSANSAYQVIPAVVSSAPQAYVSPAYTPQATAKVAEKTADIGFVSTEIPSDNTCLLNLHVPADAQVFFGQASAEGQVGSRRQFRSPQLEPGSTYRYQLRARWMQNGQWVEKTRTLDVHANDVVNVDFSKAG
jgi:uncharacterized protein (TIGR03000 family)